MTDLSRRRHEILSLIQQSSPFDPKETERILKKYFFAVPRLVKICEKYGFTDKKVLDIGAAYGQTLLYWGRDSEGVDVSEKMLQMPNAAGRKTYALNVEDGFQGVPEAAYDAIYSNNLLEHVVAPHLYLGRLYTLLKPRGLMAIGHPVTPPFPFYQAWSAIGYSGWLEAEHVNFFTPKTSKLTLERAGFRVVDQYFSIFPNKFLSKLALPFGVHCLSICEKIDGYHYQPVRHPMFDPVWAKDLRHFHGKKEA